MGYFLLLENVLEETLFDRLVHWRDNDFGNYKRRGRLLPRLANNSGLHCAKQKMVTRMDDIALSVTSAMKYLHQKGIVYRDLVRVESLCGPKEQIVISSSPDNANPFLFLLFHSIPETAKYWLLQWPS